MTGKQIEELERSPDYWWLRFRNALRKGDVEAATAAQRRLRDLGIEVRLHSLNPEAEGGAS